MQLLEVNDPRTIRQFHRLPRRIYQAYPQWIEPLHQDIEKVFDREQNKYFRHGECSRWILVDNAGEAIGRVAAFVNDKTKLKDNEQPTGGMGFFECIEDERAAFMLFDQCRQWLELRGIEAMDGPINFGDRDRWWGLLIDGFQLPPTYGMSYHPPYYRTFFEAYGFKEYFQQYIFGRKVADPLSPRLLDKARMVAADPNYSFRHLDKKQLEKFTEDFRIIYNKAWAGHSGVAAMSEAQAKNIMRQLKPIMDEEILWFGYYKEEPIAFFLMLPELNQIFKYLNGNLDWWGKIKFVWYRWRGACRNMFGIAFGIVPAYQGKGVDGAIVEAARVQVQETNPRYDYFEMNWIGDFNPKMLRVAEQVGGDIVKTYVTYRFLFDRMKPFKRCPIKS